MKKCRSTATMDYLNARERSSVTRYQLSSHENTGRNFCHPSKAFTRSGSIFVMVTWGLQKQKEVLSLWDHMRSTGHELSNANSVLSACEIWASMFEAMNND
mmetsp:Transcript_45132/g.96032  ORF Transcript_45132/g.96032 Transcript_45132/m.96032 type:complete len:101 (+) Transcript_45132:1312-1614(+)